ncbi:MAG: glycosyltransferase family 2 protein [Bacteroidota bacterium]
MKVNPTVTVLIATYNYELYIRYAIESIIAQDYSSDSIEVIIVDDGSTDNTKEVVSEYFDKIDCKYIFQENMGKAAATKLGVSIAKGKYLFVLDADDYYEKTCLREVVEYFEMDASIVQVSHLASRLDEETGKYTRQTCNHTLINRPFDGLEMIYKNLFYDYNIGLGSTFACRTMILKKIEIPDGVDMYIDYFLFLKIAQHGKVVQLDRVLSIFRRHLRSYSEGKEQFENKRKRSLRYYYSAKTLYLNIMEDSLSEKVKLALKLFYFRHLYESADYLKKKQRITIGFAILRLVLSLAPLQKSKFRYLKNNIRYLANF